MAEQFLTRDEFQKALEGASWTLIDRALARIEGRTGQSRQPVQAPKDARAKRYPARWVDEVSQELRVMTGGSV